MKKVLCISLFIVLPLGMAACSAGQKPFDFSDLEGLEFIFSSGAGAWQTALNILPDGSFSGEFVDMNMGDSGPGYPEGTLLECKFNGKFTAAVKVNDFIYTMKVEFIETEKPYGEEEIIDGVRVQASDPYGFDDADEFYIYLPGILLGELPGAFVDWVQMPMAWTDEDMPETLPFYGLYNAGGEQGFFS